MNIISRLRFKLSILFYQIIQKKRFKNFGRGVIIICPYSIEGEEFISLGDNVNIHYRTWMVAKQNTIDCMPNLEVGEGTVIGHFGHIYCTKQIRIGKRVLIADKVYISDNQHEYTDVTQAIMDQPIKQLSTVEIGDGSWIGENAIIIGAKIGRNCVVAANAVVNKDVPDFCVVAGVPAKIIKRFSIENNVWESVNGGGR